MRRAALRGCTLLLRRSSSAGSESTALLAAGLQAAATTGGPDGRRQLWGPSWTQVSACCSATRISLLQVGTM